MHAYDSRIRADWMLDAMPGPECSPLPPGVPSRSQAGHLVEQMTPELRAEMEAYWARAEGAIDKSATDTPDTSTTAGKIAVMQAYDRGEPCEWRPRQVGSAHIDWQPMGQWAQWNWCNTDYRIAPNPAPRTALQRARDLRSRLDVVESAAADGILCCLLTDIDYAPVVEVLERRISWDAAAMSALPKGRYRLLRDDA